MTIIIILQAIAIACGVGLFCFARKAGIGAGYSRMWRIIQEAHREKNGPEIDDFIRALMDKFERIRR